MTPINRHFSYYFKNQSLLRLVVKWNNNHIFISTGYHVNKSSFDGCRCKANTSHGPAKIPANSINLALEELETKVNEVFYEFEMTDRMPGKAELRSAVDRALGKRVETMEKAWVEFLREGESKRQWAENTSKSVRQVRNLLAKFRPNLRFQDIDAALLEEFVIYQTKHKLREKAAKGDKDDKDILSGYANNVIKKNCRVLKWFLKWSAAKGYISQNLERSFSVNVKTIDRPVIFLTWPELMRVYSIDLTNYPGLEASRDLFCLSSFTSLRYSDCVSLMKSQIHEDYINITTQKTASNLRIELNKYSRAILEKYKGLKGNRAVPFVSCNRINHDLKVLGQLCNISEPVTISQYFGTERRVVTRPKYELMSSHCGRRTFICNALALGIPPHIVMKWTGHSEYSAMKPYIDVADNLRKASMSKFDEL